MGAPHGRRCRSALAMLSYVGVGVMLKKGAFTMYPIRNVGQSRFLWQ
jgi:hypothetical protein